MENELITEEQYLQALEIVKRYDRQVSGQYLRMGDLLKDRIFNNAPSVIRKTPILECDISVRTQNCIMHLIQSKGLDKHGKEITVEKYYNLFKAQDPSTGTCGKKSIEELKDLFTRAGFLGHYTRHLE